MQYFFVHEESGTKIDVDSTEYDRLNEIARKKNCPVQLIIQEACETHGRTREGIQMYLKKHVQ